MWFFKKDEYPLAIEAAKGMVNDSKIQKRAKKLGLDVLDLTWEDTARFEGSCVGPNISDMTIQVEHDGNLSCMPVVRYPNFADRSADVPIDRFGVLVGNEKGKKLKPVSLKKYLGDLRKYLSEPKSWKGRRKSLLADDTHVLVSAQSCFLPVPRSGLATFNPVLFNYQSHAGSPAVLAIVATREGTSATIIDNERDGFSAGMTWGQRLFFNEDGERASFTGERVSDFEGDENDGPVAEGDEHSLNAVLLIQVPLKQKPVKRRRMAAYEACAGAAPMMERAMCDSDVEAAVIGHGDTEGPFTEIDGLAIERDPRFPIRVTVQLYRATATGQASPQDIAEIAEEIAKIYADADYTGSLVVDPDRSRPTAPELEGDRTEPAGWWENFWKKYETNTGRSREAALLVLWKLRGHGWTPNTKDDLMQALREID